MQDHLDGEYVLDTLKHPPPWFCIGKSAMASSYDGHDAIFGGRLCALHGRHAGVAWHGLLANGMVFGHEFLCTWYVSGIWQDGTGGNMTWHGSMAVAGGWDDVSGGGGGQKGTSVRMC